MSCPQRDPAVVFRIKAQTACLTFSMTLSLDTKKAEKLFKQSLLGYFSLDGFSVCNDVYLTTQIGATVYIHFKITKKHFRNTQRIKTKMGVKPTLYALTENGQET